MTVKVKFLRHLNKPEKYQYSTDLVTMYGGADYFNVIGLASDKYKAVYEYKRGLKS